MVKAGKIVSSTFGHCNAIEKSGTGTVYAWEHRIINNKSAQIKPRNFAHHHRYGLIKPLYSWFLTEIAQFHAISGSFTTLSPEQTLQTRKSSPLSKNTGSTLQSEQYSDSYGKFPAKNNFFLPKVTFSLQKSPRLRFFFPQRIPELINNKSVSGVWHLPRVLHLQAISLP